MTNSATTSGKTNSTDGFRNTGSSSSNTSGVSSSRSSGADYSTPRTEDLRENLSDAGVSLGQAATAALPAAREQLGRVTENISEGAQSIEQSLTSCVRDKPMQSLLIAAGIGVFAGLFLLRR